MTWTVAIWLAVPMHSLPAFGQGMLDPTQPPRSMMPVENPTEFDGTLAPSGSPRVEMIIQGQGRTRALIDGVLLPEGGRVREMRVQSITAQGVRLQGPDGNHTEPLHHGIKKIPRGGLVR